jgi:predicted Rossmann fold nucleotide-binding protein DprA/Smf involved in DNA uptake
VDEAGEGSGAIIITARWRWSRNREVFAIPGSILVLRQPWR